MRVYVTLQGSDYSVTSSNIQVISTDYNQLASFFLSKNKNIYAININDDIMVFPEDKQFWNSHIYTGYIREFAFLDPETGNLLRIYDREDEENFKNMTKGYIVYYYEKGLLINSKFEKE